MTHFKTSNTNEQKENEVPVQPKLDLSGKLTLNKVKVRDGGFVIDASSIPTSDTRVFLRADFNVPLNENQQITDDTRIVMTLPTIRYLLSLNIKRLIITSHLGRPKGNRNQKLSLKPVAKRLQELLSCNIIFINDWFQSDLHLNEELDKYENGSVILLENARFYIEEEGKGLDANGNKIKADSKNVEKFRSQLTSICDLYVNDAFGTCHRAHSTMVGCQVSLKVAGLLVKKELEYFNKVLTDVQRPYLAILGGAKVSDKILVIEALLDKVNEMIIAGGMCFTFIKVLYNISIGSSLYDINGAALVKQLMEKAKKNNVKIILPIDFVCGDSFANECNITLVDISDVENCSGIPDGVFGLDIGRKSIQIIEQSIYKSRTVIFNGPPGVFEFDNFAAGTKAMISAMVKSTKENHAISIVGGGDSAAAVNKFGGGEGLSHISTGGGASLELLEGKLLPGVVNLTDIHEKANL